MSRSDPATAGDVFAALLAAHHVGDYWVQTDDQARDKALPGRAGQAACLRHVAAMTATKAVSLAALHATGRRVAWRRAAVALAVDAASHYWADRRAPLKALAEAAGSGKFYASGGAPLLDQAWHMAWLYAAALATQSPRED